MPPLSPLFQLPLPSAPPIDYVFEDRCSRRSTTTAFNTGIDDRDVFLGEPRCIVCGFSADIALEYCYICPKAERNLWNKIRTREWIPPTAKQVKHEPRNGVLMCGNHHVLFDVDAFFIRYFPNERKFILINYAEDSSLQQFHGKAVALDPDDDFVPFATLFIIHEMRVRGHHPFALVAPSVPDPNQWQDWIHLDGILDSTTGALRHRPPPGESRGSRQSVGGPSGLQMTAISGSGAQEASGSGGTQVILPLTQDVIGEIVAATRSLPTWKACQREGTSWTGTAEENIQTYLATVGADLQE